MKVEDIAIIIEDFAPISYQEDYDNSGLIVGSYDDKVAGVLLCIDVTEEIIDEESLEVKDLRLSNSLKFKFPKIKLENTKKIISLQTFNFF